MKVVLTGGGSAGHMTPFEPTVETLRTVFAETRATLPVWLDRSKIDFYYMGVLDGDVKAFFDRLGVVSTHIPAAKLRRYPSPRTVSDILFRMPVGLVKAVFRMWRIMPDVVISKGGYGSVPVAVAAGLFRIPILAHESDAIPGMANRLVALMATVITVSFAATRHELKVFQHKSIVTGIPVRSDLDNFNQSDAKRSFGFRDDRLTLLVMGGSQGAEQLNTLLLETLSSLVEDMDVIHLVGKKNIDTVKKQASQVLRQPEDMSHYQAFGYLDEMGRALGAADIVVSRAGATSLAELARVRKAAIIVPLDSAAQDHQRRNAKVFEVAEAVRVISPENLNKTLFLQNICDLYQSAEIRETLQSNISRLDHPHAARDIAGLALKLASGLQPLQPQNKATREAQMKKREKRKKKRQRGRRKKKSA